MAETDVPRIELADHSNDGVVIVFEGGKSFRFPSEFLWAHRTAPEVEDLSKRTVEQAVRPPGK